MDVPDPHAGRFDPPAERTSFVLHDVFQYPFEAVAATVGRSPAACRQLACRARQALRAEPGISRFPVDVALERQVSKRFIDASAGGDLEALLALLDPDVAVTAILGLQRAP